MAVQKTQGFVLRKQDLRETSIILTVYTRDFGKLKLISKGVRAPEARFVSAYELLALDDIVFYERKKRSLFFLSQCDLVNYFPKVRESLERLSYAVYFAEFLDAATSACDRNTRIYELLLNSLFLLSSKASPKRVARIFEIKFLSILGLMPRLKTCAACDRAVEKEGVRFSFSSGGVLCEGCFAKDKNAKPVLAGTVNFIAHIEDLPFERIKHIKVSKRVGVEVERLLRGFINYHLDIRLKSMEFIGKVGV
ncbi:MAG: DNA repair protein RecO [Candidatus Omnitrophota bacterium]